MNQIGQEAQEMSGSMDRWQKLMTAPRINDEDWRLGVTAEIANWTVIYHQALALKHPDRWSNVNDCWLDALQRMDLAGQDYGEGIDRVDAGQIYRANDEVAAAVEKEKECNDKIAQLKSELNFVPAPE